MRTRILAIAGSLLLIASLGVVTIAPVAAHHDEEFSFFDVYVRVERAMAVKTSGNHYRQFARGRALTHDIVGWRQHNGNLPRWIGPRCQKPARGILYNGFKYGRALSVWGRGMRQSPDFAYSPRPLRSKVLARARLNGTYRSLDSAIERFEDCVSHNAPRRFRIA